MGSIRTPLVDASFLQQGALVEAEDLQPRVFYPTGLLNRKHVQRRAAAPPPYMACRTKRTTPSNVSSCNTLFRL